MTPLEAALLLERSQLPASIRLRLTPDEYRSLVGAAKTRGLPVHLFLLELGLRAAGWK